MRLFVAITPTEEIRERLVGTIAKLKAHATSPKWVRADALHLTLKFLGEVEGARVGEIVAALRSAGTTSSFTLAFRGVGAFPNARYPRVIWAGLAAGNELKELAEAIQRIVTPLGFPAEGREYSPHVTLARMSASSRERLENLMDAAAALASYDFGSMVAREFHLFKSILKPSGAEYSQLATFALAETAANPTRKGSQ